MSTDATSSQPDHLDDAPSPGETPLPLGGAPARWVERQSALDRTTPFLRRLTTVFSGPPLGAVLRGEPLGHALHPTLTDLPIGFWTSAVVLDVCGDAGSRPAAQRLIGLGVLSAGPTAWSGWAEWNRLREPEVRVGTVHAVLNGAAIGLFTGSWIARRAGRHATGVWCGAVGSVAASAAGYLGGHLSTARKAGYRDRAYAQDGVGPTVTRPMSG